MLTNKIVHGEEEKQTQSMSIWARSCLATKTEEINEAD